MKKLTAYLIFFFFPSISVFAGSIGGNGGDAVVCPNNVQILDLYEAREIEDKTIYLGSAGLSYDEKLTYLLEKIERISPFEAEKLSSRITKLKQVTQMVAGPLEDIPDSNHIYVPVGCEIEQIAIQSNGRSGEILRLEIDQNLWSRLDDENKAVLYLHEAIYSIAIEEGYQSNSIGTRALVGWLISQEQFESKAEFSKKYSELEFRASYLTTNGILLQFDSQYKLDDFLNQEEVIEVCGFRLPSGRALNCELRLSRGQHSSYKKYAIRPLYQDEGLILDRIYRKYGFDASAFGLPFEVRLLSLGETPYFYVAHEYEYSFQGRTYKCNTSYKDRFSSISSEYRPVYLNKYNYRVNEGFDSDKRLLVDKCLVLNRDMDQPTPIGFFPTDIWRVPWVFRNEAEMVMFEYQITSGLPQDSVVSIVHRFGNSEQREFPPYGIFKAQKFELDIDRERISFLSLGEMNRNISSTESHSLYCTLALSNLTFKHLGDGSYRLVSGDIDRYESCRIRISALGGSYLDADYNLQNNKIKVDLGSRIVEYTDDQGKVFHITGEVVYDLSEESLVSWELAKGGIYSSSFYNGSNLYFPMGSIVSLSGDGEFSFLGCSPTNCSTSSQRIRFKKERSAVIYGNIEIAKGQVSLVGLFYKSRNFITDQNLIFQEGKVGENLVLPICIPKEPGSNDYIIQQLLVESRTKITRLDLPGNQLCYKLDIP